MFNNKKTAFLGVTGSGKTTRLIELYKKYINQGISSNHILVLVRNRSHGILWRGKLDFTYSSKLRITSYLGFVQGEIQRFWPLISKAFNPSFDKLEPTFITIEMAQFFMIQIVEEARRKGKLQALQTDNDRIAIELINNMSKAAMAGVDFGNIGDILFNSRSKRDILDRELFFQLQELCDIYIEKCRNLGVLDYAMSVDIYNRILLNESVYKKYFLKTTRHIMVDDLEEGVVTEINMLKDCMNHVDSFTITYNTDGELGRSLGACPELVEELIIPYCEVHNLDKTYTSAENLSNLKRGLVENNEKNNFLNSIQYTIMENDLRSEMLKSVGEKVVKFLDERVPPSEIAIISPYIDSVTFYYLESILNKNGYELTNLARNNNLTDDAYVKALITIASIAHPEWKLYPSYDNMDLVLSMILKIDRIRSHLISLEISKQKPYDFPSVEELPEDLVNRIGEFSIERYSLLRNWIIEYQKNGQLSINKFFQKFFNEILVSLADTKKHLEACRQLIDNCNHFLKVLKDKDNSHIVDKSYIEFILKGMKAAQSSIELKEKLYSKNIILSTPYTYLNMKQARAIQVWIDISSEDWFSSDIKEITNPHVFHPHWDKARIWTDIDNDLYRINKGNIHIKRLINRCSGKIIFARSQLSRYGYEQEGVLGANLDEIQVKKKKEQSL